MKCKPASKIPTDRQRNNVFSDTPKKSEAARAFAQGDVFVIGLESCKDQSGISRPLGFGCDLRRAWPQAKGFCAF
jgi:hypothetical protein